MIAVNIAGVRQRIAAACARAGRDPAGVTLLAVAKTFPPDDIRAAVRAGVFDIGENYVQELLAKRPALEGEQIRWHFVGHLQSRKAKHLAPWITLIHSVDSESVAQEIDRQSQRAGRSVDVLVEVNTAGEASKFGLAPDAVAGFLRSIRGLEGLRVCGLMTVGPLLPDPGETRPVYRGLRVLADRLREFEGRTIQMRHLSMGMTGDFEVAIEEGATIVRIGTAVFGARPPLRTNGRTP